MADKQKLSEIEKFLTLKHQKQFFLLQSFKLGTLSHENFLQNEFFLILSPHFFAKERKINFFTPIIAFTLSQGLEST